MKNNLLIFGIVGILVVGLVGFLILNGANNNDDAEMMEKTEVMNKTDEASMEDDKMEKTQEEMMEKHGEYVSYGTGVLEKSSENRRVLFFYANWCPTCRPADESFEDNESKIPAGVSLVRVNYNDIETEQAETDLAKKYGVTYQHTFVQIDEQGNEIVKWNGGKIDELVKNLK